MPGDDPLERQLVASDLLVVAHGGGQQPYFGTHPRTRKRAQVVLCLGGTDVFEVHHQPEFVTIPHLVITVQITMDKHGRSGRREHGVRPIAPAHDGITLIRPGQRPEPVAQHGGRGGRDLGAGELADDGLGPVARRVLVQGAEERGELAGAPVQVDGVSDLEQRAPGHAPGDEEQRVCAARDDLGQERHRPLVRERGQDADLSRQAYRGGTRPRELHDEPPAGDHGGRLPLRILLGCLVGNGDGVPAHLRRHRVQRLEDRCGRTLSQPLHAADLAMVRPTCQ
jgi:hypothetical protein